MAEETPHHTDNGGSGGYERREANIRLIVLSTVGLAIMVVLTLAFTVWLFDVTYHLTTPKPRLNTITNPRELPPSPRLQEHPAVELQNLRRHEDEILNNYGWVDQKAGTVRLPIDKAMDILAQKGLPTKSGEGNGK